MAVKKSDILKAIADVGHEPKPKSAGELISGIQLSKNYSWYAYVYDHDHAKEFLVVWAKANNHPSYKALTKLKAGRVVWTFGWVARMLTNGFTLPDDTMTKFQAYLETIESVNSRRSEFEADEVAEKEEEAVVAPSTPLETLKFVYKNLRSLTSPFQLSTYFKDNKVTKANTQEVIDAFSAAKKPLKDEIISLTETVNGYDPALSAKLHRMREKYAFVCDVVKVAQEHITVAKINAAPRKPRKVKEKTPQQLVKDFKFLKEHEETGLKSIEAEKIVGAQYLYALNVNNNTLTVFKAKNEKGLSVQRTNITNYDENFSKSKRVGRVLKKVIETITTGTKVQRNKVLEGVTADYSNFSHRITENHILIRVEK